MQAHDDLRSFEAARPMLAGLAYRILGSRVDAEDAVQDTFVRWQQADRAEIDSPAAWLRAICARRCIDLLRSAHRSRVDYVGPWLPEPIHTTVEPPDASLLASSVTTAFLLLLERLTPKERAAYLLHEIFEMPHADVAAALEIQEATCRKLVSRARTSVDLAKVRHVTPIDRQERLLAAFETAVAMGSTEQLAALLADDIELCADSGGKVPAIARPVSGKAEVIGLIERALARFWSAYEWIAADINGGRGLILRQDGLPVAAVSFAYDEAGKATNIYIMRNPDKLAGLRAVTGAAAQPEND